MVKLKNMPRSFLISFVVVLACHLIILVLVKKDTYQLFNIENTVSSKHNINKIDLISKEDLARLRHVGIEHGKRRDQPDFKKVAAPSIPMAPMPPREMSQNPPASALEKKVKASKKISNKENNKENIKEQEKDPEKVEPKFEIPMLAPSTSPDDFQIPAKPQEKNKVKKVIAAEESHETLKQDALRSFSFNRNSIAAQKISNFEIRYERPEGVSEDELNSDEKAFYSFYKRSYASYVSKLYATYEQMAVARPQLARDFDNQHLLVARIDYDENGNIITIKILKSSNSDDVHHFFEETLKKLVLPNPPKIFVKIKKEFSIYYQVQIN